MALVLVVLVVAFGTLMARQSSDTQTENTGLGVRAEVAEDQRDATAGQALDFSAVVLGACATGTAPPEFAAACSAALAVQADPIPGTPGLPGAAGRIGDPGTPGGPGRPGDAGAPGLAGAQGAPGIDGASPPCLSEPAQCRGADGEQGAAGADGAQGNTGPAGPPGCDAGTSRNADGVCVPDEPAPAPTTEG